jgi:hypothetical protein
MVSQRSGVSADDHVGVNADGRHCASPATTAACADEFVVEDDTNRARVDPV